MNVIKKSPNKMKYFLIMIVGSNSEATDPEKDRPEVIIESEELMTLFDIIDDIISFVGNPTNAIKILHQKMVLTAFLLSPRQTPLFIPAKMCVSS